MNREYKEKFPEFCSDFKGHYDLVLGDDADAILVSNFLEMQCWDSTRYFYDFNMLYIEKDHEPKNPIVGCDIDLIMNNGKCWGNHVTAISKADKINTNSANLNNIEGITSQNYTSKYAGSTFATVLSYYDYDLSKLSEEAKMLILCVDSHFLGFYSDRFHDTQKKYLIEILNYPELYDTIKGHTKEEFEQLQAKYNLKSGKIWIGEDCYLQTNIDLAGISEVLQMSITLPKQQFEPFFTEKEDESYITLKTRYAGTQFINSREQIQENIFSYSQTYKNSASFTYLIKVDPK